MINLEDWQARLVLRIMNTAAENYSEFLRRSNIMSDIEVLRSTLEGQVGTITETVEGFITA